MKTTKNQIRDHKKFFKDRPDDGFSPERNKSVVDGTIRKYEQMRAKRKKQFDEQVRERSDAVAQYLKHLVNGKSTTVEKYFGRRELARLRGQRILQELRGNMMRLSEIDKGE
jgi:hypothetical protein